MVGDAGGGQWSGWAEMGSDWTLGAKGMGRVERLFWGGVPEGGHPASAGRRRRAGSQKAGLGSGG